MQQILILLTALLVMPFAALHAADQDLRQRGKKSFGEPACFRKKRTVGRQAKLAGEEWNEHHQY